MTDYFKADERRMLFRRMEKLTPDMRSASGKVTGHQLMLHFCASLRELLGDVAPRTRGNLLHRTLIKWLVFHVTPWPEREPKGLEKMHAYVGGAEARSFEQDHASFVELLKRFDDAVRNDTLAPHPVFGPLSRDEWGQYMFLHFDYHLTSFDIHGDFRDRWKPEATDVRT